MTPNYKRILLVNPPHPGFLGLGYEPNISLGYLSQALQTESLQAEGVVHRVLDMAAGYAPEDLWRSLRDFQPDLIGVTLVTLDYLNSLDLIRRIKKRTAACVVVGGPHVSSLRAAVLQSCPEIDFGVVMEGEQTLTELVMGKAPAEIRGLLYREQGKVIFTGERPFQKPLDKVAFPTYQQFELNRYLKRSVGIITSRGCPHQCTYCPVRLTSGHKMRLRSAANVFREIRHWYQQGIRTIDIWDDNFTLSPKRVHAICDYILAGDMPHLTLNLPNGVRADRVDRALLLKMKAAGLRKIAFGVEGGNDKVLQLLNKGERMADIETAIREACAVGLDVILFFLLGTPGETWADIEDSLELATRYPVAGANFYNLIPFPRTRLFETVQREGRLLQQPEVYLSSTSQFAAAPCFETPELPLAARLEALRRARQVSQQVRSRWVRHKFRRLGPAAELIRWIYTNDRLMALIRQRRGLISAVEGVKQRLLKER